MDPAAIDSAIDRAIDFLGLEVTLKEEQREALRVFLGGKDVFVALPTGFGKSLCFALIPVVFDVLRGSEGDRRSIALVVFPLTSLMMEQREKFKTSGVSAEFVGELQQDVDAIEGLSARRR